MNIRRQQCHNNAITMALLLWPLLAACRIGPVEVAPTGGAGFAGMRTYEVLQQPAFSIPASCTAARCSPVQVLDSVDLAPNHHYEWRPALSTGVAFQHYRTTGARVGGGLGVNIVVLSNSKGETAPWPAATVHLGTHEAGFFVGLIISPTDGVRMPGGASTVRVHRDEIPDLITRNTSRAGHLFLGIRLGGPTP